VIPAKPAARGVEEIERRAAARGIRISHSPDGKHLRVEVPGGAFDPDIASQKGLLLAARTGNPLRCVGDHAEPVVADVIDAYSTPFCLECLP